MNDPILDHAQEFYRLRALREALTCDGTLSVDDEERFVDARHALELKLLLAEKRLVTTRPRSPQGLEALLTYALENAETGEISEALKTALECVSECCADGLWASPAPAGDSFALELRP